jgi:hypothetical protein
MDADRCVCVVFPPLLCADELTVVEVLGDSDTVLPLLAARVGAQSAAASQLIQDNQPPVTAVVSEHDDTSPEVKRSGEALQAAALSRGGSDGGSVGAGEGARAGHAVPDAWDAAGGLQGEGGDAANLQTGEERV